MSTSLEELSVYLRESRGDLIVEAEIAWGELNVTTTPDSYIALLTFLRDDPRCQFISFIDICGVDYPEREKRFDVVCHLLSPKLNARIRIKLACGEDDTVPSATAVYYGADWFEREAYDMY